MLPSKIMVKWSNVTGLFDLLHYYFCVQVSYMLQCRGSISFAFLFLLFEDTG